MSAASAPSFTAVWDNPEDDIYDAIRAAPQGDAQMSQQPASPVRRPG